MTRYGLTNTKGTVYTVEVPLQTTRVVRLSFSSFSVFIFFFSRLREYRKSVLFRRFPVVAIYSETDGHDVDIFF